jgi:hypothetical protein
LGSQLPRPFGQSYHWLSAQSDGEIRVWATSMVSPAFTRRTSVLAACAMLSRPHYSAMSDTYAYEIGVRSKYARAEIELRVTYTNRFWVVGNKCREVIEAFVVVCVRGRPLLKRLGFVPFSSQVRRYHSRAKWALARTTNRMNWVGACHSPLWARRTKVTVTGVRFRSNEWWDGRAYNVPVQAMLRR